MNFWQGLFLGIGLGIAGAMFVADKWRSLAKDAIAELQKRAGKGEDNG